MFQLILLYVTEDAAGNLWVGTEMGLYCYDIDTDQFTRISSYFPKDFGIQRAILKIKAVGEDQIWVYTGKGGIYRIDVIDIRRNEQLSPRMVCQLEKSRCFLIIKVC